jgi:hypothetical protein
VSIPKRKEVKKNEKVSNPVRAVRDGAFPDTYRVGFGRTRLG